MSKHEVIVFDPKNVATIGNKFINAILAHEIAKEAAEAELQNAEQREGLIDIELTKTALFLHNEEKIDLNDVFGDKNSVQRLNQAILVELGILKREITDDDKVVYIYTDKNVASQYDYPIELKERDEDEYIRRRSRKNALNIRLKRVMKAALSMADAKATPADIVTRDNGQGVKEAVITKGPKSVLGKNKEVVIETKTNKKQEGAKFSPTVTGLAKAAEEKHKAAEQTASKNETEGKTRSGGENGVNEADFLAMINTTMNAVKGREGKFSNPEKTAMKNLLTQLQQNVK